MIFTIGFFSGWFACVLFLVVYGSIRGRKFQQITVYHAGEPLSQGCVVRVTDDGLVFRARS